MASMSVAKAADPTLSFEDLIGFKPFRVVDKELQFPPAEGFTAKQLAKVLAKRNDLVKALPQERRDDMFYSMTPDEVLDYLNTGDDDCYAAICRFARRGTRRRLNPFDALVFIRKVSPDTYEMLPTTFVSNHEVSDMEVPFTLENLQLLGGWSIFVKYFHHLLGALDSQDVGAFDPISETILALTRGGTMTGSNRDTRNYQMQRKVVVEEEGGPIQIKTWTRLASNTRTALIFKNLKDAGAVELLSCGAMTPEQVRKLKQSAADIITKFPCLQPTPRAARRPNDAAALPTHAAPNFDPKDVPIPRQQWHLAVNLMDYYRRLEDDRDAVIDHSAHASEDTKEAIRGRNAGLMLNIEENLYASYAQATGITFATALLRRALYDFVNAADQELPVGDLFKIPPGLSFDVNLSGLAEHCGVTGNLQIMQRYVQTMGERAAIAGSNMATLPQPVAAVLCSMLGINTAWQILQAVRYITKNYQSVLEANLLNRWQIMHAQQRAAVRTFFIPKLLGILLLFYIENFYKNTSFSVEAAVKEHVKCKNSKRPNMAYHELLAATELIDAGRVFDIAPYLKGTKLRAARVSSTAYPLKFDGRYDLERPVGVMREIWLELEDGSAPLPDHQPLPPLRGSSELEEEDVVLESPEVKESTPKTLVETKTRIRVVLNADMMTDMGWNVFPGIQCARGAGRYADPFPSNLKAVGVVVGEVLRDLRDDIAELGDHYGKVTADALLETRMDIVYSVIYGMFPSLSGKVLPGVHYFSFEEFSLSAVDADRQASVMSDRCRKVKLFLQSVGATPAASERWLQFSRKKAKRIEKGVMYYATQYHSVLTRLSTGVHVEKITLIEPLKIVRDASNNPILVTNPLYYHLAPNVQMYNLALRGHGSLPKSEAETLIAADSTLLEASPEVVAAATHAAAAARARIEAEADAPAARDRPEPEAPAAKRGRRGA